MLRLKAISAFAIGVLGGGGMLAFATYPSYLNFKGYCSAEGRYLSDEEFAREGVSYLLTSTDVPKLDVTNNRINVVNIRRDIGHTLSDKSVEFGEARSRPDIHAAKLGYETYNAMASSLVDTFFAENPNCCSVLPLSGKRPMYGVRPSFWSRIRGNAGKRVRVITFFPHIYPGASEVVMLEKDNVIIMNNCGGVSKP